MVKDVGDGGFLKIKHSLPPFLPRVNLGSEINSAMQTPSHNAKLNF